MAAMKTPGVYIVEKSASQNSVVEAATSIPAFIGITEKAQNGADSLAGQPWKITSMTEFNNYFSDVPEPKFEPSIFTLYDNLETFFADGGKACYIVSIGIYDDGKQINKEMIDSVLKALEKEQEITMVIVPEAMKVKDCKEIQQLTLKHCGEMTNRFDLFDVQLKESEDEAIEQQQENLNMPMNGMAVNAIRTFLGEGIKVWGARTLDGNSQDWRYVNVRRTMLFLEESVKNASKAYVFEPNVSNTWVSIKSMIDSFLCSVWKRGGLAGSTPEEAFEVHVGLGDTMTANDILDGIMRITVLVAISRPAEFIEITFQQQMQKSQLI